MTDEPSNTPTDGTAFVDAGATIDETDTYRYRLWRVWNQTAPTLGVVMCNPSTADATSLDPTCRRCVGYAREWGYGSVEIGNLFALRSPDPTALDGHPDPIGPANNAHLDRLCARSDRVVAAWGTRGALDDRGRTVAEQLDRQLWALDTTKDGHPIHPLYQPADIEPEPWAVSALTTTDD